MYLLENNFISKIDVYKNTKYIKNNRKKSDKN